MRIRSSKAGKPVHYMGKLKKNFLSIVDIRKVLTVSYPENRAKIKK